MAAPASTRIKIIGKVVMFQRPSQFEASQPDFTLGNRMTRSHPGLIPFSIAPGFKCEAILRSAH
jgi:hypothetical protein